ncbi:MBG domain-containing protein [Pseudofulvimonas gallinarii]|uniref:Ig-like protein group 1 n=1 Tax=Pseudofulvimonas gallinarii TaxID=634155 RepID=A0A4R3LDV6_9GAMM|nr:MBG domain-containing protein [Pseudofulvimonas gallinarii]TCS98193.1 Ig-like protein group 1 [Pseudofulvimonas gallinarii]
MRLSPELNVEGIDPGRKAGCTTRGWGLRWLLPALMALVGSGHALAANWYVATNGNNSNSCESPEAPCQTIQAAIDKAGVNDTVYVAGGNYAFTSNRIKIEGPGKNGLRLIGQTSPFALPYAENPVQGVSVAYGTANNKASNAVVLQAASANVASGNASGMIWVRGAQDVRIENLYIEVAPCGGLFCLSARAKEGVIATGAVNGLTLVNNYFKVTAGTNAIPIGISVAGTTDSSAPSDEPRGSGNFVHIEGNVIEPSGTSGVPKRAIAMQNAVGVIIGNQVAATTQDMWIQSPTVVSGNPAAQKVLKIEDNWFFGRLQLYLPSASGIVEPLAIRNNHFIFPSSFSPPGLPSSTGSALGNGSEAHSVRVMASQTQPTIIEGNEFKGFRGQFRALWVMSRAGVTVQDNVFTPELEQTDFTAVLVGNRQVWNGLPAPTAYGVTFLRNTFHANGATGGSSNKTKAILFLNDNDPSGAAPGGTLQIGDGTLANANHFDADIRWYIALDDRTCATANSHNSGTNSGCRGASNTPHVLGEAVAYSGGSNASSYKRPFRWDVNAPGNIYGGLFMGDMNEAQFNAVKAKTFADHNKVVADADVGDVLLGWTPPPPPPTVELDIGVDPDNNHKTGELQAFTLAAVNTGGPGLVRGRIIVSRADGAPIPQRPTGDGSDDTADSLLVMTGFGLTDLVRSVDGNSVSLVWPPFDVQLDEGAELPPQDIGVLFRVPGEYNVLAEIFDAIEPTTVYGSESFTYAVTQDLDVTITGDNPTGYTGSAQPLAFFVTPASNPAVADLDSKVALAYNGSPAAPVSVGTYAVTATTADADYVPQLEATDYTIGGATAVHRLRDGAYFASVADALADAGHQDGDTLEMAPGTYSGPIVLNKPVKLVGSVAFTPMAAGPDPMPSTIIDGGGAPGNGITITGGVQDVEIRNLEVRNFGGNCIYATSGNHGLVIANNYVHHCGGNGAIYPNAVGGLQNVLIEHNLVHDAPRGIIIWNGFKQDITIADNHVHGPNTPSGILLNDGRATGVHITGNLVENTEDTGIAVQQLTSGSPSLRGNLIADNEVFNPGRLGISLQVPNGTGGESGDGAIVVQNNIVSGVTRNLALAPTHMGAYPLDRAGISVVRRFFSAAQGQTDVTRGVIVRGNEVRDFLAANPDHEAYGIVVEGLNSTVAGNVLENNQFGLQIQQGNAGHPGDAPLPNEPEYADWFDRGNAPFTCVSLGVDADENNFAGNGTDERHVPADVPMVGSRVLNQDTGARYCSINAAIAAATAGDTLVADAGVYVENVVIDKPVTLRGAQAGVDAGANGTRDGNGLGETIIVPATAATGVSVGGAHATDWSSSSGAVIRITSDDVVLDGVVVDADNPDLVTVYASGRPDMNGANPDVAIGVNIAGRSAVEVINVVVRNPIYYGIGGTASALAPGDRNIIANSRIINSDGHGYGVGILLYESLYAHVDNNHIEQVRTGIQAQSLTAMPPTAGFEAQAEGNLIKATGVGIWANVLNGVGSPPTFHVRSNTIHAYGQGAEPTLTAQWNGIWVHSLTRGGTVSISGNSIDGSDVDAGRTSIGYLLGNVVNDGSAANVISGGSVSHVDIGVLATDSTRYDGPVDNFEVTDVDFSSIALAAFYVEDTQKGLAASSAHLSIGSDNSYDLASSAHTLVLSGPGASVEGVAVDDVFVRSGQTANIYGSTDAAVSAGTINNGIAAAAVDGVVQVEAGSFAQAVTVNKRVRLLGAQAGVDASSAVAERSGGETIIAPDAPVRVRIPPAGSGSVLDGFTITGTSSTTSAPVAAISTTATDVVVRNNRIIGINGNGVYLSNTLTQNIVVEQNRFAELTGGSYNGVKTEASNNLRVLGNHFSNIAYQGIQLGGLNVDTQVVGNRIEGTAHGGINIGGGNGITVTGNELYSADTDGGPTRAAIRIYAGVAAEVACNMVDASNNQGIYFHSSGSGHIANVFHNAIAAPLALVNDHTGGVIVGSNWYGGAAPSMGGNGPAPQVAVALESDPSGDSRCGINTPHSIVAYAGTGTQSTPVDTAFTDLRARVQDELGGAVMGVEVAFSDPSSSTAAGATLGTLVGNTDLNGELVTTAVANGFVGSYTVSASSGSLVPASFALTNTQGTATVTVSDVTAVYNGAPHAVSLSTDPAGLEADVQIVYTDASSVVVATCAATAPACGPDNAGTYIATATIVDNPNYGGTGSGTLTINRAATTIVFAPLSFEYNGSTHIVSAHLADEPGTACPVTGTVGPDVVGSPYTVNAVACVGSNYEAPAASDTAVVTPLPTALTFGHLVQAYDGSPKSVTVTTSPMAGVAVAITYDGSPTPPTAQGSYAVAATITDGNFVLSGGNTATLEIVPGASDIALVLSGPVDDVPVGELAHYAATMIANPALHTGETFGYKLVLSKTGGTHPLALSDIASMEVFYGGAWLGADDIGLDPSLLFQFDIDGNLVYYFPQGISGYAGGFPIEDPSWTWNFRFSFADTGVYTTSAELVDGLTLAPIDPVVSASLATVVVDALPPTDIHLVLSGPASAVQVGDWAEYAGTLIADPSLHVGEDFFVKVRMSRNGGAMTSAELAGMQIFYGGSWIDGAGLTFTQDGNELVYLFPADLLPGGFPITSEEWTWNFRFQYAEADVYTAVAEVIHAADAGNTTPYVFDTAAVSTTVVDAPVVIPDMHLLLTGPLDAVELGATAQYTGTLVANPVDFAGRNFFVRIRLSKNGGAEAMTAADLAVMELFDGSQWVDATTLLQGVLMQDGNELVYLFPRPALDSGFPISSPVWSWNFRFTYGDTGVYSAQADVVDAADIADVDNLGQVAAAASLAGAGIETVVVTTPQIVIDLQGPVVGEVGQALQYVGYLDADPLPDSSETFFVAVRLDKNGGADPMTEADLSKLEISFDGGASWMDFTGGLPLVQDGNALTYEFPQPLLVDGFPITGPWAWNFRFTYADEGIYRAEAVVVTADAGRTPVSNTATVQTTVFAQTPDIAITLQGPVSGIGVGEPAHYTGSLTADPLPASSDEFIVRVRLGKNGGADPMTVADLLSMAISADGVNWTPAPEVLAEIHPDPTDGNYLLYDFPNPLMASFPITGPWTWHFQFTYGSVGTYSAEATVLRYPTNEVVSNTAGVSTLVGLGSANIAIDPASLYVVYDGAPKQASVSTMPAGLSYTVTYNGSSTVPVNAGSYLVEAGIDAGQGYTGSASATMVVAKAVGTVSFAPLSGSFGTAHAVTATLDQDPAADCAVTGTPDSAAATGAYLVSATCEGDNHVASGSVLYQVVPAAAAIEVDDATVAFNGLPQALGATTTPAGLAHVVTYEGVGGTAYPPTTAAPAAVGEYLVTATVTEPGYAAASDTALLTILDGVGFTLGGDTVAVAGSDPDTWSHFTATTANPSGITLGEQLVVEIAIERGGGIAAGDVQLQVEPYGAPGTWVDIPLAVDGDSLAGTFGPYTLDPVASTANLRAKVERGGRYTVVAAVAGASSDTVFAIATHSVDAAELGLVGSGNATGTVAAGVESALTLVNSGTADLGVHMPAPNDENVRGRFFIEGPVPLTAASSAGCGNASCASPDVSVEFYNPVSGSFQHIYNLRAELDGAGDPTGRLYGHFGSLAAGGLPVPAGYAGSFLFRTTFLQHTGTYTVTSQVIGVDSGKVYAEAAPHTVAIGTGAAASIELVSGDAGEAVVGGNAYDNGDLVVRVRDAGGNPVAGAAVAFNVETGSNGAGASFTAPALTDAGGETSIAALSNTIAGDFAVSASIGIAAGQQVEFVLRNVAGDASQLHRVSGSGQTAALNQVFGMPLTVRVTDVHGNAVAGETVSFAVPASGASATLDAGSAVTDGDGFAEVTATANGLPGHYTVAATVAGIAGSADFGLANTAEAADTLALAVTGSDEAVVATGSYSLAATVTGNGLAVPGVSVTFVVEPGAGGAGATTSHVVALTGEDGVATATFNANAAAGPFTVRAVASGTNDDAVTLTNLADAATSLAMVSGSPQSAVVDSAFAQPLVVRATDIHGNPVAGIAVTFTSQGSGANALLAPANGEVLTGVDGTASVGAMANGTAGSYMVQATAAIGSPVDFSLTNTTGAVTISDIVWLDSGTTTVVYDGSARVATATASGGQAVSFTYNGSSLAPVDAGTYLVIASVDDGNVQGSASAMLTIAPATVDVELGDLAHVYDGTARLASVTTDPAGVGGVSIGYLQAGSPVAAPVDAGSYDISVQLANANYVLGDVTPAGAQLVISPAPVSVAFGSLNHVYDGTAKAATVTTTPAGVGGISLSYSQGGVAAVPVDAGSYDVTASLANPNYSLTGSTAAVMVIAQANASVVLSDLLHVYDGTAKQASVTTVPAGLPVNVTYNGGPAPSAVGSYAVLAVVTDGNYSGTASGTLQIVPAGAQTLVLTVNGGSAASATVGTANAYSFVASVADSHGNPLPGVAVAFTASGGGAGINPSTAIVNTGADGEAVFVAGANNVAGVFQVTASATDVAPASVTLTNTADVASSLQIVSGTPQAAQVNSAFADLVVRVTDVHGNAVSGVTVTFDAPVSAATAILDPANGEVVTAGDGLASVSATANGTAGSYVVSAAAAGVVDGVDFALQNVTGSSGLIVKVAGDAQTALAGTAVAIAPQVRVEDGSGNVVEGAIVSFAVTAGGGSATGATVMTGADGLAEVGSWTLGSAAGSNELTASVIGSTATPVVFTATATAQVDAAVSVMALGGYTRVGAIHDHVIVVRNDGVTAASGVSVEVPLPAEHDAATAQWLCLPAGGASCPATTGTGAISTTVNLPAGSSLTFLTSAMVVLPPIDELVTVEASVSAAGDIEPSNDSASATTVVVLFRNGFEVGGDGTNDDGGETDEVVGELRGNAAPLALVDVVRGASTVPAPWLVVETAQGRAVAFVDRVVHGGTAWIRLRDVSATAHRAGAWIQVGEGVGLALGSGNVLLLDSGVDADQLRLAVDAGPGLIVVSLGG